MIINSPVCLQGLVHHVSRPFRIEKVDLDSGHTVSSLFVSSLRKALADDIALLILFFPPFFFFFLKSKSKKLPLFRQIDA